MPIKFWRIPFHCYQSGGGSRFYRYFDDVTILLRILHLSEDLILVGFRAGKFYLRGYLSGNALLWLSYSVLFSYTSLALFDILYN